LAVFVQPALVDVPRSEDSTFLPPSVQPVDTRTTANRAFFDQRRNAPVTELENNSKTGELE
jgi:hypothetical protein